MLPPCFPPVSTVWRWFYLRRDNGLWLSINHVLLMMVSAMDGREASPSASVIDSQRQSGSCSRAQADIQDRDGAPLLLTGLIGHFPWLRHLFADGGYAGDS